MKNNFYNWLRPLTEKAPSPAVDTKILAYSSQFFSSKEKEKVTVPFLFDWKISSIAVLASVALLVVLINKGTRPQPSLMMITESPEMVLNYNEIELMADASKLTEADWAKINGTK